MTYDGRLMSSFVVPAGVTLNATTNAGGPTPVPITAGTYVSLSAFLTQLQADLIAARTVTAGTWQVSLSTGASGTGKVTIAVTNGVFSITWVTAELETLLGFAANIVAVASSTGAKQARGLWMPDCPLFLDRRLKAKPVATDQRQTESPTGTVIAHVGNLKYRHRGLLWSDVPLTRTWLVDEATANESLETFLMDTQWQQGHTWFTASSKCVVIAHDGNALGNSSTLGWSLKGVESMDAFVSRAHEPWDAFWKVAIREVVTDS